MTDGERITSSPALFRQGRVKNDVSDSVLAFRNTVKIRDGSTAVIGDNGCEYLSLVRIKRNGKAAVLG